MERRVLQLLEQLLANVNVYECGWVEKHTRLGHPCHPFRASFLGLKKPDRPLGDWGPCLCMFDGKYQARQGRLFCLPWTFCRAGFKAVRDIYVACLLDEDVEPLDSNPLGDCAFDGTGAGAGAPPLDGRMNMARPFPSSLLAAPNDGTADDARPDDARPDDASRTAVGIRWQGQDKATARSVVETTQPNHHCVTISPWSLPRSTSETRTQRGMSCSSAHPGESSRDTPRFARQIGARSSQELRFHTVAVPTFPCPAVGGRNQTGVPASWRNSSV